MDGNQGSDGKPGGRRIGRAVWVAYVTTGAALAVVRVSVFAWAEQRSVSHQMTETVYSLFWIFRPEILLSGYTRVGAIHFESLAQHFLFWGSVLTVGSFLLATPILLVGWLRRRR
jgi:hypothetical protein